jgi:hypothetical protein
VSISMRELDGLVASNGSYVSAPHHSLDQLVMAAGFYVESGALAAANQWPWANARDPPAIRLWSKRLGRTLAIHFD